MGERSFREIKPTSRRLLFNPVVAAIALTSAVAAPARADWGYTHWGMTPQQVVAASAGGAHLLPPAQRTRNDADHWEISVSGDYRDGGLNLSTGYMFDTGGHGLVCVLYNTSGPNVERLHAMLIARLGKPKKDSDFGTMRDITWRTPDAVEFAINKEPLTGAVTHCAPGH